MKQVLGDFRKILTNQTEIPRNLHFVKLLIYLNSEVFTGSLSVFIDLYLRTYLFI